ncbi:MAG: iron ABC transporter permease [Actinomycetes bacterium]
MKKLAISIFIATVMVAIFLISLRTGILHLSHSIFALIGKHDSTDATTVWDVRFPRVMGALIIGAGLGVAGGLAQGIFRNPLAEPTLIGLSSGATLGTITVIGTGIASYGSAINAVFAILFAILAATLVQLLAPNKGNGFLLTGLAISAVLIAVAGLVISISPKPGIQSLAFWNFGSLTLLNNSAVAMIAPFIGVGLIIAFLLAPSLDGYSLGESTSHFMGINPKRIRYIAIIAMALLVGASVSAVGAIAFLGLLVPHIVRLLIGPSHRAMLAMSALVGATLLMLADLLARTVAQPHEIPLGLLTSLIGAPALIILLRFQRSAWVDHD